ncbi:hypothetical protein JCM1840_000359 [Sporobolomyces johnsonii]
MGTLTALKRRKTASLRAAVSPPPSPPTSTRAPAAAPSSSTTLFSSHGRSKTMPQQIWKAPKQIGFLERWWIYYEGIFACSMLETLTIAALFSLLWFDMWPQWEKVLLHSMLFLLACIFYVALSYLPAHLRVLASHGRYYAFGTGDWAPA